MPKSYSGGCNLLRIDEPGYFPQQKSEAERRQSIVTKRLVIARNGFDLPTVNGDMKLS
jgi:hypothetical protein